MLAQVTYIPKFIMTDSADELMLIVVAASAAFVANNPKQRASACQQYQTYLIPPADVVRASARRTTPGRCHDFWNSHNRCPMASHDDRPMQNQPAGRLSEFPALGSRLVHNGDL